MVTFVGLYLGIIFLISSAAILAFKKNYQKVLIIKKDLIC